MRARTLSELKLEMGRIERTLKQSRAELERLQKDFDENRHWLTPSCAMLVQREHASLRAAEDALDKVMSSIALMVRLSEESEANDSEKAQTDGWEARDLTRGPSLQKAKQADGWKARDLTRGPSLQKAKKGKHL